MPLATMPCWDGFTPVVRVACTEQVTAGKLGVRDAIFLFASHFPRAEPSGTSRSRFRLRPGMSITQTRFGTYSPLQGGILTVNSHAVNAERNVEVVLLP